MVTQGQERVEASWRVGRHFSGAVLQAQLCDPVDALRTKLCCPASAPHTQGCLFVRGCEWHLPQPPARRVNWWRSAFHSCLQAHRILVADEQRWEEPRVTGWMVVQWGLVTQLGPRPVILTLTTVAFALGCKQDARKSGHELETSLSAEADWRPRAIKYALSAIVAADFCCRTNGKHGTQRTLNRSFFAGGCHVGKQEPIMPILICVSGTIYKGHTINALRELGVSSARATACVQKLHTIMIKQLHTTVTTSRWLEHHQPGWRLAPLPLW
eukprot:147002-Chlamydomonas_euryale.AAC.2